MPGFKANILLEASNLPARIASAAGCVASYFFCLKKEHMFAIMNAQAGGAV
jgi:hypothetical protein